MSNKASDKNVANIEDVNILGAFVLSNRIEVISQEEFEDVKKSIKNILAELEQKDKRIQELEKEKVELKEYNKIVSDRIVEYKKNSIPTQVVIDLIKKETIDISGFKCIAVEDLQELLEGEK